MILLTFHLIMQCLRCFVPKGVSREAVGCDGADIRTLPSCSLRTRPRDVGAMLTARMCPWPQDYVVLGNVAAWWLRCLQPSHTQTCQPCCYCGPLAWSAVEGHRSQLVWFGVTGRVISCLVICFSAYKPPQYLVA